MMIKTVDHADAADLALQMLEKAARPAQDEWSRSLEKHAGVEEHDPSSHFDTGRFMYPDGRTTESVGSQHEDVADRVFADMGQPSKGGFGQISRMGEFLRKSNTIRMGHSDGTTYFEAGNEPTSAQLSSIAKISRGAERNGHGLLYDVRHPRTGKYYGTASTYSGFLNKLGQASRAPDGEAQLEKAIDRRDKGQTKPMDFDRSPALDAALDKHEAEIHNKTWEQARVFDRDGNHVHTVRGVGLAVHFDKSDMDKIERVKRGAIVTHNHPDYWKDSGPGRTLSDGDIKFAHAVGAKEIRAVTRGYVHSLRPPEGQERFRPQDYEKTIGPILDKNDRSKGPGPDEDRHNYMVDLAAKTGMRYSRTKHSFPQQEQVSGRLPRRPSPKDDGDHEFR